MTRILRVDELTAPPVVGRFYLVPTVRGEWYGQAGEWPVQGDLHEDRKFFDFPWSHYHLDRRFLPDEHVRHAIAAPLMTGEKINRGGLPAPVWKRRKCRRAWQDFPAHVEPVLDLQESLAGVRCRADATGWICPHRNLRLGSVAPDDRGVIACPMHGLRIDAATGVVLDDVACHRAAERGRREAEADRFAARLRAAP